MASLVIPASRGPGLILGQNFFPPPPGEKFWPHTSKWAFDLHWTHWLQTAGWSPLQIAQYKLDRDYFGIGYQPHKRKKPVGDVVWFYRPIPKQVEAHRCALENLLYGGAAGGSKSHFLRYDLYKRCHDEPGYRAILFRRQQKELYEHHLDLARRESALWGKATMGFEVIGEEIRFPNDSLIRMGYATNPGDEMRYLSIEYDCIDMDELATFERSQAAEIMSRVRTTKEGVRAFFRASSNPAGQHTLWVVDRFITKTVTFDEDPFYEPEQHHFIQARLYDNPYYMDPDGTFRTYERRLGALAPIRRKQLLEGDWSAITGQFFKNFINRPGPENLASHVNVLPIPRGTKFFRCLDWGYTNPGVCYWIARLPDGHLYVYYEYKFVETIVSQVAQRIVQITRDLAAEVPGGVHCTYTVVDPSMESKTGATGESMLDTLQRFGVPAQTADNERVIGWQRFRHWLELAPDGRPWLIIHPRCEYAIRTIPALVSDTRNPEDVDTEGDDHAGDAIRYGLMSRPMPTKIAESKMYPPDSIGWWQQWMKKYEARQRV